MTPLAIHRAQYMIILAGVMGFVRLELHYQGPQIMLMILELVKSQVGNITMAWKAHM
jgi:hypothetical protein